MATRSLIEEHRVPFVRFCLVGGVATILNYSAFFALFQFLNVHYLISSGTGYLLGVAFGFYFNKTYTFENGGTEYYGEAARYLALYVASLFMGLALLRGLVTVGVPVLLANVVIIGFTTMTNYLGSKYVVFSSVDLRGTVDYYRYRFRYLLRYILIGVGALALEITVIAVLSGVSPYQWGNTVFGFALGMVFSYVLNAWFNFDVSENRNFRTFQIFAAISSFAFLLNVLLIELLFQQFSQQYGLMRFASAACIFLVSYSLHTRYTFDTKQVGLAVYLSETEDVDQIKSTVDTRPDFIHLDLVDETYNENADPVDLEVLDEVDAAFPDTKRMVHIMSEHPRNWAEQLVDDVDAVIFHPEGDDEEIGALLDYCRDHGCDAGLSVSYDAPIESMEQHLHDVDVVQVLGIERPGVSGQGMASEALETVERLSEASRDGYDFEVCFDGGVKRSNVHKIDADYVVSASAVLKAENPKQALYDLKTNARYYSNVNEDFKRHLTKGIGNCITSLDFVESGTLVGSFVEADDVNEMSDVDIVVIVDELTESKYDAVVEEFSALKNQIEVDYGYDVELNTTFGPLKFDEDGNLVFHLMVYDREGHERHCRRSPFTCLAWQHSDTYFKRPMTDIARVPTLQPNHFFTMRRSISDYLTDLNRETVSYREYEFDDGPQMVQREKEMTDKDRFEFSYHIMKFSMMNFLKLYRQENVHYDLTETVDRYFSVFPKREDEHTEHLLELQQMKYDNEYPEWTDEHSDAIRAFLEDFEQQFESYFADATTVQLLRHEETDLNRDEQTFLGQGRDPSVAGSVDVPDSLSDVDAVYTSPLARSYETASALKRELGLTKVVVDDRLAEIDYGEAEGLTYEELERGYPELVDQWDDNEDPNFPGGENTRDVLDRVSEFLDEVEYGDDDAAVVTHNVVLRCILGSEYDVPMWQWHEIVVPHNEPLELLYAENGNRYINLTQEQVETCFRNVDFTAH
ncbi:GtrA family protein [Halobaculum sp. P14]|uniref:GtrA family protein n=1 Tax=Halobaculum sp. P14 TaxID=3421638 RepID=UPI003EB9FA94